MNNVGRGYVTPSESMPGGRLRFAGVGTAARLPPAPSRAEPPKLPVADDRPVRGHPARLFLRRREEYTGEPGKDIMQGQVYVEVLAPEGRLAALSARAHPWRGADRNQLDGNAGWAQRLGRIFRRAGLRRLHDRQPMRGRSAWHPGDGATRMFTAPAGGIPVYRQRGQGNLAAGEEAHAMAWRRPEQGAEGGSDLRCVLRHAGGRP